MGRKPLLFLGGLGLLALVLLAVGASAQRAGADPIPGWERFVEPLMVEGTEGGLAFFPAEFSGSQVVEILDPYDFNVHLTRADDPGEELVFPAGELMPPPQGRWRFWLQGEWSMTPFASLTIFPGNRQRMGVLPRTLPIGPAGRVAIGEDREVGADLDLWLLYAGGNPRGSRQELSRRLAVSNLTDGILMPSGSALAGLWNRSEARWVALSRPFQVQAGRTMPAPLGQPAPSASWLKIYVEQPAGSTRDSLAGLTLDLSRNGVQWRPDFTLRTAWGVHAVWYGLEPGPSVLAGGNSELYLEPQNIELRGGAIEHFDGTLTRRPSLQVNLVLPSLLREKPLTLEVRKLPDGQELAKRELSRDAGGHRFDGLVRRLLEVVLSTHVGSFHKQVDLTNEDEGFVVLEPQVIEVYGTVYHGDEPHPAALEFRTVTGDLVETVADEAGEYRAVALHPLLWLRVDLDDVDQETWVDLLMPAIRQSRELDIEIPDADVRVRVVDSMTGEGIAGADVAVRSEYRSPMESGSEGGRETAPRRHGRSHVTDDTGLAKLPPPRPGRIEITVSADGYRPKQQPLVIEIMDPPQDREVEIRLEPFGDKLLLRLALPDGSPAAGAEVARVDSASSGTILSTGRANAAGTVEVPVAPSLGLLLLKHPGAAFGIIDWLQWKDEERVDWTFPALAEHPLSLRVWGPWGEKPAPRAYIALWVGEHRLSGASLVWLLNSRPMADQNGFWTAGGLPRVPLRILAWSRHLNKDAEMGTLDTLATPVPFPWPVTVDVRAVQ